MDDRLGEGAFCGKWNELTPLQGIRFAIKVNMAAGPRDINGLRAQTVAVDAKQGYGATDPFGLRKGLCQNRAK